MAEKMLALLDEFWTMVHSCFRFMKSPFLQISKEFFIRRLARGSMLCLIGQQYDCIDTRF